jgi:hypothetical protein
MDMQKVNNLLSHYNKGKNHPVSIDSFTGNAKRYIKAIKEGRVICSIGSVSNSGMSRTIKFVECAKSQNVKPAQYYYLNFFQFFEIMGFTPVKSSDYFRIGGCGMDMIFHTNYTIINSLAYMGLISKKEASKLAQKTPTVI